MPEYKVKPDSPYPGLAGAMDQMPKAACGVYLFKEAGGRVLYVGKAVNLRNRLRSYLQNPERHDPKTDMMLKKAARVDFLLTATEREALILERNLIKEHRPRFNVMLRDDKNYLCLRLNLKEEYPTLRFVRHFHADGALYFGPYSSACMARETLKVMKRAFKLRTCKESRLAPRSRPCLEYQLEQCLAPCAGMVDCESYRQAAQEAAQFLKGRGRNLLKQLKAQMAEAAANLEFEKAATLRDRITAINQTLERQDMARPSFRDQDVLGVARKDGRALVLVLMVRGGLVTGSREYYFPDSLPESDLLGGFLKQYYTEERPLPDEILLPYDLPERRLLQEVFREQKGGAVRLVVGKGTAIGGGGQGFSQAGKPVPPAPAPSPKPLSPTPYRGLEEGRDLRSLALPHKTNHRTRLLALAAENAWAAWERRQVKVEPMDALRDLHARLHLPQMPERLECLDISNLQGSQAVGALVAFTGGVPDKSGYRRFRIREVAGQDDYAMLREVVRRHYGKEGQELPDLLVVDGGQGQLNVVLQALKEMDLPSFPVVGLAKAGTQEGREVRDRLFLPGRKNPRFFPANAPGWLLLLRLRDEAHRFAITYHRGRARKELLHSLLDEIPGIGPVRRQRLFQHYPDLEALKQASVEDLAAIPGFTRKAAAELQEWLAGDSREKD
ncbi:MAG: excinuclease ABC subunit C [Deltaproteobacteria bacterium]|nr:excinuclease ABC subunit C [Deltaproteobacteria bacterium]